MEDGYVAGETEIGKIYYKPEEVRFGAEPEVQLISFFMGKRIAFKDISAVI